MGAFVGIPLAIFAVAVTGAIIWGIIGAVGAGAAQAGKEVVRKAAPGIVPDDPPTEEELQKAEVEAKRQKALEDARLAAEAREARRPQTLEEAHQKVASAKEGFDKASIVVEDAVKAAKARGGGWGVVSDARAALQAAEDLVAEAAEDLAAFNTGQAGGSASPPAPAVPPPSEDAAKQEGGATKMSHWHGGPGACRAAYLGALPAARMRTPQEFPTFRQPLIAPRVALQKPHGSVSTGQVAARALTKLMRRV